jgi:hypothetical protein
MPREPLFAVLAASSLFLAACATTPRPDGTTGPPGFPSEQALALSGLPPARAAEARQIYLFRCAKCHRFYDPAGYEQSEWDLWMRKMSRKAHLNASEQEELVKYLDAYRSERLKN